MYKKTCITLLLSMMISQVYSAENKIGESGLFIIKTQKYASDEYTQIVLKIAYDFSSCAAYYSVLSDSNKYEISILKKAPNVEHSMIDEIELETEAFNYASYILRLTSAAIYDGSDAKLELLIKDKIIDNSKLKEQFINEIDYDYSRATELIEKYGDFCKNHINVVFAD